MAYHTDSFDNALVIDGWQAGIAANPYDGISDARNVLIASVPGEVSVGFSTGSISAVISSGTVTAVASGTLTFTGASGIETGMAISFSTVSGYSGITAGTAVYWVTTLAANTFNIYSDFQQSSLVSPTGSGSIAFTIHTPDFSNYQGNIPQRFCRSTQSGYIYLQDTRGKVWTNRALTTLHSYWKYIGNAPHGAGTVGDASNGNGIVYYQPSSGGAGFIFVFSDSSIDYFQDGVSPAINYGWNPMDATKGNAVPALYAGSGSGASHDALVGQDNVVYFCDSNFICSFFEKSGQTFDPSQTSTYTAAARNVNNSALNGYALKLPYIELATCLAEGGTNLLIGGVRNLIYPWDRISTSFLYPIWLSESNTQKMITVQTNTYIFTGNRGRIHITNGSQAQVWKKVPDHLSGTVEPYFRWGAVASNKNQLYFSAFATTNGDSNFAAPLSTYGGIWAIDLTDNSLRMVNQLSYATYGGYAPALFASTPLYNISLITGNLPGASLFVGWYSGSTSGIDQTLSTPYTNSQAYIDSDLIPIGTFNKPRNFARVEYLLTKPLVSGESITIQYRPDFSQNFTTIFTDSTVGNFTNDNPVNFQNVKWIQFRAILNSTASSPSYVRLKHLRLTGLVGPTMQSSQQLSI